ncbi:MAG: hypothetical protein P8186_09265 [Anaerolineae bacterium]|jgi:hypothetical protein
MTEKSNPSFQKARDEALRALILRGGLAPDQVSSLKLNQVHLATNMLVIEPDEFAPSSSSERSVRLKLDESMQRVLIAWLVVRPDSANDHLFPGTGLDGLDVATINRVIAAAKSAEAPRAEDKKEAKPSPPPPRSRVKDKAPSPPPPSSPRREEPQAVPLDEIESLRKRLAEVYDDWAPVAPRPPKTEIPAPGLVEPEGPPRPRGDELEPAGVPKTMPEEVPLSPRKGARVAASAAPAQVGLSDTLKRLWKSGESKLTLNLPYRGVAIGGGALVLVCCIGLIIAGGTVLRIGGPAGPMADATPSETALPTETTLAVAINPSPSPTLAATSTPTPPPSATLSSSPASTDTPAPLSTLGPTPTPMIIVVTATPTPEPPPTATAVPTNTPVGGIPSEPTATPTPGFKYPAPVLLEPKDGTLVPGLYVYLKWEPVGPLADDEWYTVRLVFSQQGELVYEGDSLKITEWQVPERFYYQADGPALEYRWYVFVERKNSDGSTTQLSPESKTFLFRWR